MRTAIMQVELGGPAIRIENLVKDYGSFRALDGVELRVEVGEVFGFIGPNGAGKSTTIGVLLDLLRPTSGRVEVFGSSPADGGAALRARIGYLPGELAMAGRTHADSVLRQLARLRGGRGVDRIGPLAEWFGLDLHRPVRSLSKGNKQKIGVIQAFMHDPDLLILDEPTSGLDPLLQHEFLALVREAQDRGATVLMSSHVLGEVQDVADRVAIIRSGKIIDVDDVATLRHRAGQRVELRIADQVDPDHFRRVPGVEDVTVDSAPDGTTVISCELHGEPDSLLKVAARHHVVHWSAQDGDLEELFLDLYREPPETTPTTAAPADEH